MAYEIKWYVEGRIIYDRLYGDLTFDDAVQTSSILTDYLGRAAPLPLIHVIVDLSEMERMPLEVNLKRFNQAMQHMKAPNLGWTLMITSHPIARFLASTLTQIARARFRTFTSREEALAFLSDQDETLAEQIASVKAKGVTPF
jgi:hypothetical protein